MQPRGKFRRRIVGSKKDDGKSNLKSAVRKTDIYLGICSLDTTSDDVKDYILKEINVTIDECVPLNCKDPRCKSFRISLDMRDKDKLLEADVWPEEIMCRQFFHSRKVKNNG